MAKAIINPEAELPPRGGDIHLTEELLSALGAFAALKKTPAFAKFPGTCVLRHFRPGEVICRQGDAGGTAFYLLTGADLAALAQKCAERPVNGSAESHRDLQRLLQRLSNIADASPGDGGLQPRRLATARLLLDAAEPPAARPNRWLNMLWRRAGDAPSRLARPATIPNDGPSDIDYDTRQAAIYEGEVFGEMSCLTRQPRSATVAVDSECFVLEFLRNILEQMRKDAKYNELAERKYRERVLEGHLRQLSIFQYLSDDDFQSVCDRVELVRFAPGTVIWDEGDPSDALYVVRSGIVQVVQAFPWRLTEKAISDWSALWDALRASGGGAPAVERLRAALPKEVHEMLAAESDPAPESRQRLIDALNELAKSDALLSAKETQRPMSDVGFMRGTADFPTKVKSWTGLQVRRGNRLLYHSMFPQAVLPADPAGLARVMQYLGRGGVFGEIGVIRKIPRTATCVAYAHPRFDIQATDVELVRVPAEAVYDIEAKSQRVRAEIQELITFREERSEAWSRGHVAALPESRRAEELGLLQGQNLMLIDLDRCTRCGDCVQACIDTHDDGHSRLFLDGPRYGKYLIPSSCRQCRDPVCMIGCPVGSIQQGEDGEIQIRDWCIGCGLCADQCPYDSIQMHDAALLPSGAPGWLWNDSYSSRVAGNWNQPGYKDTKWRAASAPFFWGIDMHQALAPGGAGHERVGRERRLYFRAHVRADRHRENPRSRYRLLVTSQGSSIEAYLNGRRLQLSQDAAQKRRFQFVADLNGEMVWSGENVLAITVSPPDEFHAIVLDARLDTLAPESQEAEEKLVTQHAVVCDQCSSLSGGRHACVYACPHEAALRIDAWADFPAT